MFTYDNSRFGSQPPPSIKLQSRKLIRAAIRQSGLLCYVSQSDGLIDTWYGSRPINLTGWISRLRFQLFSHIGLRGVFNRQPADGTQIYNMYTVTKATMNAHLTTLSARADAVTGLHIENDLLNVAKTEALAVRTR